VPNYANGHTVVVDVAAGRVAADLAVVQPGSRLELLAKDGFVFYNDLDGDRAGVITFEAGRWRVGKSLKKYDESDTGKGILTPAGDQEGKDPSKKDSPAGQEPTEDGESKSPEPGTGSPEPGAENPGPGGESPVPGPGGGGPSPGPGGGGSPSPGPSSPGVGLVALTVQVTGGGSVIAQSPAPAGMSVGVQCTSSCQWQYPRNTDVVLRAPLTVGGATFGSFAGCDSVRSTTGSKLCELTLTGPKQVSAVFVPPAAPAKVTLTAGHIGTAGKLTATVAGGSTFTCDSTCSQVRIQVVKGTGVNLKAFPAAGNEIAGWFGASCGRDAVCPVTVSSTRTVTVVFRALVKLTVTRSGSGKVTGTGINCGSGSGETDCTATVSQGTDIILTATPGSTAVLNNWSFACSGFALKCTVDMSKDKTVSAAFVTGKILTITVSNSGRVTGTPIDGGGKSIDCGSNSTCKYKYRPNTRVSLRASSDSVAWGGACFSNDSLSCPVTMDANKSVTARFQSTTASFVGVAGLSLLSTKVYRRRIGTVPGAKRWYGKGW
jgi:hypothetical protein